MKQPVYIVDIFREIVSATSTSLTGRLQAVQPTITGVHYLVGHYTEISTRLQGLSKMQTGKFDRYPLIALFQDFVEKRGDEGGYYASASLQLLIVYHTKDTDYTEDRYSKVFKPILYPIYEEFLRQVSKHKNIVSMNADKIPHEKIDRPNWGNSNKYGNDGNIFPDDLDGIELRDLKIIIDQKC